MDTRTKIALAGVVTPVLVLAIVHYWPSGLEVEGICRDTGSQTEYSVIIDNKDLRPAANVQIAFDFWDTSAGTLMQVLGFDPSTTSTLGPNSTNERFLLRLPDQMPRGKHLTIHLADITPKPATNAHRQHPKVVVSSDHDSGIEVSWDCNSRE